MDRTNKFRKLTVSEEELRNMVTVQRLSDVAIGKKLGVCNVTVLSWRQRFGIEQPFVRKQAEAKTPHRPTYRKPRLSEAQLRSFYEEQGFTQRQIGKFKGVSQATVGNWLRYYGIEIMNPGGRTEVVLDKEELRRLYHEDKLSMEAIAKHCKCGESTVRQNLLRYDLAIDAAEVGRRKSANNKHLFPDRRVSGDYIEVRVEGHPAASLSGHVPEHRAVVEKAIGRYLEHVEQVHHINTQKLDNRIENLAVMPSRAAHSLVHKYMERISVFLLGLTDERPAPLVFEQPVFWGGEWLTSIDLIARKESRPSLFAKWVRANGLKYEIEDAA